MNNKHEPISLALAATEYGLSRITLAQAAREGRLVVTRLAGGRTYYTTRQAVLNAIEIGKLRPRRKDAQATAS